MINSSRTPKQWLILILLSLLPLAGCRSGGLSHMPTEPERRAMLSLMLPNRIQIMPFTRVASLDKDNIPDGLIIVLRPTDRFGEPVKAAGPFYFELWSFQQASGEPKKERLAFWEQALDTPDKIASHWTHAQTYEFKLGWPEGATSIRPGHKYVVTATYRTPWDETMVDEHIMEFTVPPGAVQQASDRNPPQTAPAR